MSIENGLFMDKEAYDQLKSKLEKELFIFQWLTTLEKTVRDFPKAEFKQFQSKLTLELQELLKSDHGPPVRRLLGNAFVAVYSVGDTYSMYDTITVCLDLIKGKADNTTMLGCIEILGHLYEKLGRSAGGVFPDALQALVKSIKSSDASIRKSSIYSMEQMIIGLETSASYGYKDLSKAFRSSMTDKSVNVKCKAAQGLRALTLFYNVACTSDLDSNIAMCLKVLEGANYDCRIATAQLIGTLLSKALQFKPPEGSKVKSYSTDEVFTFLSMSFLHGSISILKTSGVDLGKSVTPREVRVGITEAYTFFFKEMNNPWVVNNLNYIVSHLLDLLSNSKATPSHVEAVYSRKCISFVMDSLINSLLGEASQLEIAKILIIAVHKQMENLNKSDSSLSDAQSSQHIISTALYQLSSVVLRLGTASMTLITDHIPVAQGKSIMFTETVFEVLLHPSPAARLTAAWCLRCTASAVPAQLTALVDICTDKLEKLKTSPEALFGFSHSLAALIGCVGGCPLGMPHSRSRQVMVIAEDMLRTSSQNTRLSLPRTQCGWLLLGALMTLGSPVVKSNLSRLMLIWKNAFPRSTKELESETERGDLFTWQVTLEGYSGALMSMFSFLVHCQDLCSEDILRRLAGISEVAVNVLSHLPTIIKQHGAQLKAATAMVRLRLYSCLLKIPPKQYDGAFANLLRQLVSELVLNDQTCTMTSLLRKQCHRGDSIILGIWLKDNDHQTVEEQLQPNSAAGSGAVEHDSSCVFMEKDSSNWPLPLGVMVVDSAVRLFGKVFPSLGDKHKLQLLSHFNDTIKNAKGSRQLAVQVNIFTAYLAALKYTSENKMKLGNQDVISQANQLAEVALTNPDPILRCAAGEALGRMAQVIGDPKFISTMAQKAFESLKSSRDAHSRTGNCLALGCLHRYVGSMGSGQHFKNSVAVLHALARDTVTQVQVWALHGLSLIADTGGPMFRGYVTSTLDLVGELLLTESLDKVEVHQCLGNLLTALITSLGPDLQMESKSIAHGRNVCLVGCAAMQIHPDPLVQCTAIQCLQQLHLFAPRHVNMKALVVYLCNSLFSKHLLLRRECIACLRQLAQRHPHELADHHVKEDRYLASVVMEMLDLEQDAILCDHIREAVSAILGAVGAENPRKWLSLCKGVLSLAANSDGLSKQTDMAKEDEEEGDEASFGEVSTAVKNTMAPRWTTKLFAIQCVKQLMIACKDVPHHVDLQKARQKLKADPSGSCLVFLLSDLVRATFIASTSYSDQLRREGLSALQMIIHVFCGTLDPDYDNHALLEQYQAQVGAALRPAFEDDTPPDVTSMACQVCNAWISSGVSRDASDLKRIQQLLVSSLQNLQTSTHELIISRYNESTSTLLRLSVLQAWAEVYVRAHELNKQDSAEEALDLLSTVEAHESYLSELWMSAIRDHALLALPPSFATQLPPNGGTFYCADTIDSSRPHYRRTWPSILHAAAMWLNKHPFRKEMDKITDMTNEDRLFLSIGVAIEALCAPSSTHTNQTICICLEAFTELISSPWSQAKIAYNHSTCVEYVNVLHRIVLTRSNAQIHIHALKCLLLLQECRRNTGEGSDDRLEPGNSFLFANLEMAMCVLLRRFPEISPTDHPKTPISSYASTGEPLTAIKELIRLSIDVIVGLVSLPTDQFYVEVPEAAFLLLTGLFSACAVNPSEEEKEEQVKTSDFVLHGTPSMGHKFFSVVPHISQGLCSVIKNMEIKDSNDRRWLTCITTTLVTLLQTLDQKSEQAHLESYVSTLTVLICSAPPQASNVQIVYDKVSALFSKMLDGDMNSQLTSLRAFKTLIMSCDPVIRTRYIRSVSEAFFEVFFAYQKKGTGEDLTLIKEIISIQRILLTYCLPNTHIHMISLIVPVLISMLGTGAAHALCLAEITYLTQTYPAEVRNMFSEQPHLQQRLATAIRTSAAKAQAQTTQTRLASSPISTAPKIALKMDFSNFK
ncbi:HEAT repeat-containing protein 5B-like [Bolinopsis microptera]|uniref:HEAT repeat-containing protein 5B-like n=1 Tax=Bolinopsis microptera TaxID=2820187 RepID=UPI00307ADA93